MGADKALIEVGDQPLAQRVAARIGQVCGQVSLVGEPERYGGLGLPVVPDRFPGQGPLAGIEAALGATAADWNLVVACDMPSLDTGILEALFAAAAAGPGADGAAPAYGDGRVEPLCAVLHTRCHAAILAALEAGVRRVTEALARLELRYIPVATDRSFANLNTPEDLERFRNG